MGGVQLHCASLALGILCGGGFVFHSIFSLFYETVLISTPEFLHFSIFFPILLGGERVKGMRGAKLPARLNHNNRPDSQVTSEKHTKFSKRNLQVMVQSVWILFPALVHFCTHKPLTQWQCRRGQEHARRGGFSRDAR